MLTDKQIKKMDDKQAGDCVIEGDLDRMHEILRRHTYWERVAEREEENARLAGVLTHVPTYKVDHKVDLLPSLIELQERMGKGRSMAEKCQDKLDSFTALPYHKRVPKHVFMGWVDRKRLLWTHWWKLKDECAILAGKDSTIWPRYFNKTEEELTPYYTTSDSEELDNIGVSKARVGELYHEVIPGVAFRVQCSGKIRDFREELDTLQTTSWLEGKEQMAEGTEITGDLWKRSSDWQYTSKVRHLNPTTMKPYTEEEEIDRLYQELDEMAWPDNEDYSEWACPDLLESPRQAY